MIINYSFQNEAFEFIKDKDYFALFMDMGLGKSRVLLRKIEYLIDNKLITKLVLITPNFLKFTWKIDHLKKLFTRDFSCFVYDGKITTKKEQRLFDDFCSSKLFKILIVNVDAFQNDTVDLIIKPFIKDDRNCFVAIDESSTIKTHDAKRTIKIIKGFENFKYKAILTGTPITKSPVDLYSQFEFLKKGFFGCSFYQFKLKHVILIQHKINFQTGKEATFPITEEIFNNIKYTLGKHAELTEEILCEIAQKYYISFPDLIRINKMKEFNPYKDIDKLNQQISVCTFKKKKEDCIDLPEKIYQTMYVELTNEQKKLYKNLCETFQAEYDNKIITVTNALSLATKLRMITSGVFSYVDLTGINFEDLIDDIDLSKFKKVERIKDNPKIKSVTEDIENNSYSGSIIIWSNFIEAINYIYDELKRKFTCEILYGNTKNKEDIKANFINKSFQILICNPAVGGMGLNFQHCHLHYFFDNSYRSDFRNQAEDRSHRIGQDTSPIYKDVFAKDTIDYKIYQVIKNNISLMDYFKSQDIIKDFIFNIEGV